MFLTVILLTLLFAGSVYVWSHILRRWRRGQPVLTLNDEPRALWKSASELLALYVAILCMMPSLWAIFQNSPRLEQPLPTRTDVAVRTVVNLGLAFVLPLTLASRRRPLSLFGIRFTNLKNQVQDGVSGYFAAVVPMAISLFAYYFYHDDESRQVLLKLWLQSDDAVMVGLIVLLAAVSVPLMEELLYRMILQGWLSTLLPAPAAILTTALVFSFVHGWKNGVALLPLALILGYVFQRRHSFVSVVVIHSLYNATMLVLQRLNPP